MTLTPSHIIEYLFCPRFTYFEYVLAIPQYEDRKYKVTRGRDIHLQKLEQNSDYLRRRIGVVQRFNDQYLTNEFLRGKIDEVLLLEDGSFAPLDYKFAVYENKIYETYKTQLFSYACLIEENFKGKVNKGFLVYTRSQNKLVEISIEEPDKEMVKQAVGGIREIIEGNFFPKATKYKARCVDCTYRNICIK